jgi:hypothetical protein
VERKEENECPMDELHYLLPELRDWVEGKHFEHLDLPYSMPTFRLSVG